MFVNLKTLKCQDIVSYMQNYLSSHTHNLQQYQFLFKFTQSFNFLQKKDVCNANLLF